MAAPRKDITGKKFGRLTALCYVGKWKDTRRSVWAFACECGARHEALLANVTTGQVRSCGCLVATSAGLSQTEKYTWNSYIAMIRRCTDEKHFNYQEYGGRGISVYFDWLPPGGFPNFLRDMGARPRGMTIDRKEVDGNYEPDNCRWATAKEQRMNQRRMQGDAQPWTAQNLRANNP